MDASVMSNIFLNFFRYLVIKLFVKVDYSNTYSKFV